MANIIERNGKYRIQVYVGRDNQGNKIVKSTTYLPKEITPSKIKKEVEEYARTYERKVKNGEICDGDEILFRDFYKVWQDEWAKYNLTIKSKINYKRYIEKDFLDYLANIKINKITSSHIQPVINRQFDKGLSTISIKHSLNSIRSIFNYAYRMNIIENNPCDRVQIPKRKPERKGIQYFNENQVSRFLEFLNNPITINTPESTQNRFGNNVDIASYSYEKTISSMWKAYFTLAIYGGFRREEMLALTWKDINTNKNLISINKSFQKVDVNSIEEIKDNYQEFKRKKGIINPEETQRLIEVSNGKIRQVIKETKTESSNREIMLPNVCFEILDKWKNEEKALSIKLGSIWKGFRSDKFDKNYVFIQLLNGLPMDIDTPTKKFKKLINQYNQACKQDELLPEIRLHDLRHTSATILIKNNMNIETIAKRLGHSDVAVTLNTYGHAMKEADQEASRILESILKVDA